MHFFNPDSGEREGILVDCPSKTQIISKINLKIQIKGKFQTLSKFPSFSLIFFLIKIQKNIQKIEKFKPW